MSQIKLKIGALRRTRWHEYLTRLVLGGLITSLTGWLAGRYGPVLGGLFLAFPAIYPCSATLLESHERARQRNAGIVVTMRGRRAAAVEARGAVMGGTGLIAFAGVVWQVLPRIGWSATLLLALLTWLAVSSLLWYLRKHHPWGRASRSGSA